MLTLEAAVRVFWESLGVPWLSFISFGVSALATAHIVLRKRDVRAAIGWTGFVWFVPFIGTLAYIVLGINRIRREAVRLRRIWAQTEAGRHCDATRKQWETLFGAAVPSGTLYPKLVPLAKLIRSVSHMRMTSGNDVRLLVTGTAASEAMLAGIEAATKTIGLETYIFHSGPLGQRFIGALSRATQRGVQVRVLVDGFGSLYGFSRIQYHLRKAGVPCARFGRRSLRAIPYLNLRLHRKLLLIDGELAFTGGMNINEALTDDRPGKRIEDLHFEVRGPAVEQMSHLFAEDWSFATRETLGGAAWFRPGVPQGDVFIQSIPDGPDEDLDTMRWALLGAVAGAEHAVRLQSPYFLPDPDLQAALCVAAMRGVRVQILVPAANNVPLVRWASFPTLGTLASHGCEIRETQGTFDHSKLAVVDDAWSLIGSSNLDPRSLRLNFELNLGCINTALASECTELFERKWTNALALSAESIAETPRPQRLRNGVARLLTPYL